MSGPASVVIVDDDRAMRNSMTWCIEAEGFAVSAFPTAEEFLAAGDPKDWGCLVLDVHLPGMNGIALQHELARRGIRVPIIFISGRAEKVVVDHALAAGAVDFLEKPFHPDHLVARIRQAIAAR